ncbi:MAG: methyltransferase domain-containing protein [Candidatus Omnitrophota bacterium]
MGDKMLNEHKAGQFKEIDMVKRQKGGISSFALYDAQVVLMELGLEIGSCFLDLGCGAGDFSISAAKLVGDTGKVYALDKWEDVVRSISAKAVLQGLRNIEAKRSDILGPLPVRDNSVDACLLATVLHIPDVRDNAGALFAEVKRVMKTDGRLIVVEIKKEQAAYGPPAAMRLSREEAEIMAAGYGFSPVRSVDLGHFYMIKFRVR